VVVWDAIPFFEVVVCPPYLRPSPFAFGGGGGFNTPPYFGAADTRLASTYTPLTPTGMRLTAYSLPPKHTAYTNRYAIYRPRFTSYGKGLRLPPTPKRLRLPPTQKRLRLSSMFYLLPLGVSLLVLFCLLGLVLLYPSARLGNRIISWYFAHLCRSSPYSCFALRLRAFRR